MPLYEYQCDACGRQFELIRKFSDPPLETCPHCGGTVCKLFSSPAIQFKGSGFYITDYAKKDQTPASPSGESKSDTASKDQSKDQEKGATGEKSEKGDKTETTAKSDKESSTTDSTASSSSSAKNSTSSTKSTKDST